LFILLDRGGGAWPPPISNWRHHMGRPASFPLPLLSASRRPSLLRCEECFHLGGVVRVSGRLLCGECFRETSLHETAKRSDLTNPAYERVA
jgi:hypothetical protein